MTDQAPGVSAEMRAVLEAAFRNDPNTQELCEQNGLTEAKFVKCANTQQHLDLFCSRCTTLHGLRFFPKVTSLCVLQQSSISSLAGVDKCTLLHSLWLTQCSLTRIEYLDALPHLRQLHLSSNKLTRIEGLGALRALQSFSHN